MMFCQNCSKLAVLATERICVRCQGKITNNISCICDNCSKDQKVCSVCLKKISVDQNGVNKFRIKRSCRSCGR